MMLLVAACGNAGSSKTSDSVAPPVSGPTTTVSAADLTKNVPVDAPGVTNTEIKVASITAKTNNLTGTYAPLVDGIKAYFQKVNDAGGIYGRKLVVKWDHDDQFGQVRFRQIPNQIWPPISTADNADPYQIHCSLLYTMQVAQIPPLPKRMVMGVRARISISSQRD